MKRTFLILVRSTPQSWRSLPVTDTRHHLSDMLWGGSRRFTCNSSPVRPQRRALRIR